MDVDEDRHSIKIPRENNYDVEKNIKLLSSTKIGQNRDVWFTFKFIEMILSAVCLGFHMNGALNEDEPQPHIVYFCGTFVTFFVLSLIGQLRMLCGASIPPLIDSMIAVGGSFCFYVAAFTIMHLAEHDFHLKYLSDEEEAIHYYFLNCKRQSIASLICASVFLLHAVYVIDSYVVRGSIDDIGKFARIPNPFFIIRVLLNQFISLHVLVTFNFPKIGEKKNSPTGPIQLELFYRPWLEKIKFFRYFFERIETVEAVAVWKRLHREAGDDNLGPGINVYVFEEPISGKRFTEKRYSVKSEDSKMKNYINMKIENEKVSVDHLKSTGSHLDREGYYPKFDSDLISVNSKQLSIHSQHRSEGSPKQTPYSSNSQFQIEEEQGTSSKHTSFNTEYQIEESSSKQNIKSNSNTSVIKEDDNDKNDQEDDEVRKRVEKKRDKITQVNSGSFDSNKFDEKRK